MTHNKRLILFVATLFIVIPAILFFWVAVSKPPKLPGTVVTITPTPNPADGGSSGEIISSVARVVSIFPDQNTQNVYLPIQQIEITLNKTVDPANIVVVSEPKIASIKAGLSNYNPNVLRISPDPAWQRGVTTITIQRKGIDGEVIFDKDIVYRINTSVPGAPADGSAEYEE